MDIGGCQRSVQGFELPGVHRVYERTHRQPGSDGFIQGQGVPPLSLREVGSYTGGPRFLYNQEQHTKSATSTYEKVFHQHYTL